MMIISQIARELGGAIAGEDGFEDIRTLSEWGSIGGGLVFG